MEEPEKAADLHEEQPHPDRGSPAEPRAPAPPVLHRPHFFAMLLVHAAQAVIFIFVHVLYLIQDWFLYLTFGYSPKIIWMGAAAVIAGDDRGVQGTACSTYPVYQKNGSLWIIKC